MDQQGLESAMPFGKTASFIAIGHAAVEDPAQEGSAHVPL